MLTRKTHSIIFLNGVVQIRIVRNGIANILRLLQRKPIDHLSARNRRMNSLLPVIDIHVTTAVVLNHIIDVAYSRSVKSELNRYLA